MATRYLVEFEADGLVAAREFLEALSNDGIAIDFGYGVAPISADMRRFVSRAWLDDQSDVATRPGIQLYPDLGVTAFDSESVPSGTCVDDPMSEVGVPPSGTSDVSRG